MAAWPLRRCRQSWVVTGGLRSIWNRRPPATGHHRPPSPSDELATAHIHTVTSGVLRHKQRHGFAAATLRRYMPEDFETRIGAGFEAMAAAEWSPARDAFTSMLEESEVPEALIGLASVSYWLGDLTETAGIPTLGAEGDGRCSDRHRKATSGSTELGGRSQVVLSPRTDRAGAPHRPRAKRRPAGHRRARRPRVSLRTARPGRLAGVLGASPLGGGWSAPPVLA